MELVGLVIEKTKPFPCVIVKTTFHVTCGIASFQIQKMKLILFCRVLVSQRIWTPRGFGPPADLDPPRIWTPRGFGPRGFGPPADLDPPVHIRQRIWTPLRIFGPPLTNFPFKHSLYHIW